MKKNYFLTFLLTILISGFSFSQDLLITGAIDGPLPSGYPKGIELYAVNAIPDLSIYGIESAGNGSAASGVEYTFPNDAIPAGTYIYLAKVGSTAGFVQYLGVTPQYENDVVSINGDDTVILYKNGTIEDSIGVIGEDGTGKDWEHLDGWAYRKDGKGPNATFDSSEWDFSGPNALDGCDKSDDTGTNAECSSVFPVGTYSPTASTSPSLKIDSPTDGSTIAYSANPVVKFTVSNFNVAAGGAGDGFIKWKLDDVAQTDKTDTNDITFSATAGSTYKVYIELVDNSGNALSTPVNATVNFTVDHPCDLLIGDITTTCDALTSGADTYNGSFAFTGGNTGVTYTITAVDRDNNAVSVGTIGGDDPSSSPSGTITVTGIPEGTDVTVTFKGDATSSCDFTRSLFSPTCIAFPIIEPFDYTDATNLGDQERWENVNSGDEILVSSGSLSYTGLASSSGNKITFSEIGIDALTRFNNVNSGTVYASFMFKVTAFQTGSSPDVADGGYFAALAGSSSSYDARIWVRPNPDTSGTTFDIGFGHESFNPTFTSSTFDLNDVIFVVMGYNMDTSTTNIWINPDASSFEGTIPAATITTTDDNPPSAINTFIIRQDSDRETPFIEMDELRISTSWAEVTPKDNTASIVENSIDGFAAYPNPVKNGKLTISSKTSDVKNVSIYNVLGRKVFSETISGTSKQLNISSINSGIYILKVVEGTKSSTKKLVVR